MLGGKISFIKFNIKVVTMARRTQKEKSMEYYRDLKCTPKQKWSVLSDRSFCEIENLKKEFTAPEKYMEKWALKNLWSVSASQRAEFWGMTDEYNAACNLRAMRTKRKIVKDPIIRTVDDRRYFLMEKLEKSYAHELEKWCQRIQVAWTKNSVPEFFYRSDAEWGDRKCWASRHGYPIATYHTLVIRLPQNGQRLKVLDKNTIGIGSWQWHKGRGHSLTVRYHGTADTAAADFIAATNQEMRRAVIARFGEQVVVTTATIVQRDDFGALYDVSNCGRFVRVVCPTTNTPYWLGVKPNCETAHEAVAESFGLTIETYSPTVQV